MDGTAAMVFQGSWIVDELKDTFGIPAVDEKVRFFPLSADSDVVSWQAVGDGSVYAPITGDPAREAAALQFIDWATGEDYVNFLDNSKQFPMMQGHDAPEGVAQALIQANDAFLANSVPQFQQTLEASYGAFEVYLQEMLAGQRTPQEIGDKLADEFATSARDPGLPGFWSRPAADPTR